MYSLTAEWGKQFSFEIVRVVSLQGYKITEVNVKRFGKYSRLMSKLEDEQNQ